jgi:hypothetical protein
LGHRGDLRRHMAGSVASHRKPVTLTEKRPTMMMFSALTVNVATIVTIMLSILIAF